jgi:hypothetical protein
MICYEVLMKTKVVFVHWESRLLKLQVGFRPRESAVQLIIGKAESLVSVPSTKPKDTV